MPRLTAVAVVTFFGGATVLILAAGASLLHTALNILSP